MKRARGCNSFDAREWVKEWNKCLHANPTLPYDDEAMLGWFANAIMRGFDTNQRARDEQLKTKRTKRAREIIASRSSDIVRCHSTFNVTGFGLLRCVRAENKHKLHRNGRAQWVRD